MKTKILRPTQKCHEKSSQDSLTYITIMSSLNLQEENEKKSELEPPTQYPEFFDDSDYSNMYLW